MILRKYLTKTDVSDMTAAFSSIENEVYRVQYTAKKHRVTLKETWMKEITEHF